MSRPEMMDRNPLPELGDWSSGTGPLYRRLAEALRSAIKRGELPAATRLPPERALARQLGLSRTTVVLAYDVLRAEDLLGSRQGSGTWVRQVSEPGWLEAGANHVRLNDFAHAGVAGERGPVIDFTCGCLPPLPGLVEEAVAAIQGEISKATHDHGYGALGMPCLRRAIARHLARSGLPTAENQILVTNGAQQALGLVAELLLEPGEGVLLESPTYLGAIDVFRAARARLLAVPVGPEGANVQVLSDLARRRLARFAYLTPTFHNPTGTVLPEAGRKEVARLAATTGLPVVEDDTLREIALEEAPPRPIAAWAPNAPVITVGSMSKLFWGGLRVGWIRAPESLVVRLAGLKVARDLGTSVLSQLVAARLIDRAEEVRARRRRQVLERRNALIAALRNRLPSWSFTRPSGGLSLWVRLPHRDASGFAEEASRQGVSVLTGPITSPDGRHSDHLRLVFVHEPAVARDGVERLARAWKGHTPALRQTRALEVIV